MRAEIETYARELGWILDQVCAALGGLTAAQLDWRPSTGAANSLYAIASHVVGSTRVYALGFGCGHLVERDRAAEFAAAGAEPGELVATIRQLARELDTALAALAPSELDQRIVPAPELWGTGQPREDLPPRRPRGEPQAWSAPPGGAAAHARPGRQLRRIASRVFTTTLRSAPPWPASSAAA
jgi:hypothetical protein